MIAASHIV